MEIKQYCWEPPGEKKEKVENEQICRIAVMIPFVFKLILYYMMPVYNVLIV